MKLVKRGAAKLMPNGWKVSFDISNTEFGPMLNVSIIHFNAKVKDQIISIAANPNQQLEDLIFMVQERTKIQAEDQCITLNGDFSLLKTIK